jgi:hypothetical protein
MEVDIASKNGWEKAKDAMKDLGGTILGQVIPGYFRLGTETQQLIALEEKRKDVALITSQALRATNEVNAEEAAKNAKLALDNSVREIENQKKVALAYAQTEQEKFEIEQHFEQKKLDLLNEYAVKDKAAIQALLTTIEVQQIQHADKVSAAFVNMLKLVQQTKEQALNELKSVDLATAIQLTPLQAAFQKGADAAHSMGVTLRTDLVVELDRARAAMKAFLQSGIVDSVAFKGLQDGITKADQDLKNFGKTEDSFLSKSHAWKQFKQDIEGGKHAVDQLKISGAAAFDSLTANIDGAFQSIITGQKSVGKALEEALAQSLVSIASQAAVKALFYTAEGFAALGSYQYSSATQYFTAAGEMAAVAAAAGVAGAALSGAGGGGSGSHSNAQGHDSVSNTGQSNRSGGSSVGVQAFADGGLITGPTLALMGERGREAVIPLDNPSAAKQMREAGVGGDTHIHLDVHGGLIAESTITNLCKHISKNVLNGRVQLHASNSLRITKRSA